MYLSCVSVHVPMEKSVAVVSCPIWMLGTNVEMSGRPADAITLSSLFISFYDLNGKPALLGLEPLCRGHLGSVQSQLSDDF